MDMRGDAQMWDIVLCGGAHMLTIIINRLLMPHRLICGATSTFELALNLETPRAITIPGTFKLSPAHAT